MTASSLTGKPELTAAEPVHNDGFWPDLQLMDFVKQYRIPAEYDAEVIRTGLTSAMYSTNDYLKAVQESLIGKAYETFEDAASDYIPEWLETMGLAGVSITPQALFRYKEAVFCRAKAMLLQQFNTVNRRPNAENAAKTEPETEDFYMRGAAFAVKKLFELFDVENNATGSYGDGFFCDLI